MNSAVFEDTILAGFRYLPGVSPAVYRPAVGAPVETFAMVENRQTEVETRIRGEFAEIRIPARDVPAPATDDSIVADGEEWQVRPSTDQFILRRKTGPFWILRCRRDLRPTMKGGK